MTKAYQYTADGYYAEEVDDYGLLPSNATYTAPELQEGHIPRWTGKAWEQVENHKGVEGYLNGQPHTIKDYGPLPVGWSDTPPPPTEEEIRQTRIAEIKASLTALDAKAARPMRALLAGVGTEDDQAAIAALEVQAQTLRTELTALEVA